MDLGIAKQRLEALTSGRHYGSAKDSECWTMIGRDVRDVDEWSIVPPEASLTLVWGEGACTLDYEGGSLTMEPGDWMWIDAGFAHRGKNRPGSDFLTVFVAESAVISAGLDLAPIGAAKQQAPDELAGMLAALAVTLLDGTSSAAFERPALDSLLDWIGTVFEPRALTSSDLPLQRARESLSADPRNDTPISEIAAAVSLSAAELSRRFAKRYRLAPAAYRKQLRLVLATRELARGQSVTEAARNSGFSDTAHLSRTFKQQYNVSPSAWVECVARG